MGRTVVFQIFSQGDWVQIHEAGLRILEEVGVRIHKNVVLRLLLDDGVVPDEKDSDRVYLPHRIVKDKLALCPRQSTIKNRLGKSTVVRNGAEPL
jgi:trimethylamine:corrinoid methyltransferase-like protein